MCLSLLRCPWSVDEISLGETCSMQHTVCIESICTIQTLSAHTVHSWVGFCIPHLQNQAQSCELHPTDKLFGSDFASCILHPAILHHAEESILGPINAWTRSSRPATSIQLYTAGGKNVSFPTCKVHPLYTSRPSKVHSSVGVCSTAAAQSSEPRSGRRLLGQHPRLRLRLFY